jgi:hypothetical protein
MGIPESGDHPITETAGLPDRFVRGLQDPFSSLARKLLSSGKVDRLTEIEDRHAEFIGHGYRGRQTCRLGGNRRPLSRRSGGKSLPLRPDGNPLSKLKERS